MRILEQQAAALGGHRPAGALLFTCNGRGSRLFSEPDRDARLLAKLLGDIPVAGFFCGGEEIQSRLLVHRWLTPAGG